MKRHLFKNRHTQTEFIQIDTGKCKACWKCIDGCHKKVIGKIDFLWHRHAKIDNADNCTGCLKCIKICEYGAYTKF